MPKREAICKPCSLGGNDTSFYEKSIVLGRTGTTVGQDSGGGYACVCMEGGLDENFLYLLLVTVSCKTKTDIKEK